MRNNQLMKVPDDALIADLKKTIKRLEFKIGQNESYIDELHDALNNLIVATNEERVVIKKDHLYRLLCRQNSILSDIIHDYRIDMAKLINKCYEATKNQKDNT